MNQLSYMLLIHSSTLSSSICDIFVHKHRQCPQPVEQSSQFLRHVHCLVLQPDLQLHLTTSNNDVGAGSLSVRMGNHLSPCLYQPNPLVTYQLLYPSTHELEGTHIDCGMPRQLMLVIVEI